MIEKRRISAASESPQINDEFDNPQVIEIGYTKGFYSMPEAEDEAVVVNAFGGWFG